MKKNQKQSSQIWPARLRIAACGPRQQDRCGRLAQRVWPTIAPGQRPVRMVGSRPNAQGGPGARTGTTAQRCGIAGGSTGPTNGAGGEGSTARRAASWGGGMSPANDAGGGGSATRHSSATQARQVGEARRRGR
jgi:hypothetical protein